MKYFLTLTVCLFAASSALAESVEVCPTLPVDSGIEWTYHEGPDFDVCYASLVGSEVSIFGIYLGNHPNFHLDQVPAVSEGVVAGQPVKWYRQNVRNDDSPFARQTLLTLNEKRGYVAHVWVTAKTEQQLKDRLAILERISFKQ